MTRQTATITDLTESGLVFATDTNARIVGFTFGKIPGYKGQPMEEVINTLGVKPGTRIVLALDDRGSVISVQIAKEA